jgi:hypothetical protein
VVLSGKVLGTSPSCSTGTITVDTASATGGPAGLFTTLGSQVSGPAGVCSNTCPTGCATVIDLSWDAPANGSFTNYTFGGTNTLRITSSGGTQLIATATITVTAQAQQNFIRQVKRGAPGQGLLLSANPAPGYMNGVVITEDPLKSAVSEIFAPFVNRAAPLTNPQYLQWAGMGRAVPTDTSISALPIPAPTPTVCDPLSPSGCPNPSSHPDFNEGPTPIANDGTSVVGSGGKLFVGNYAGNGDLRTLKFTCLTACTWGATPVLTSPPWCNTSGACDRIAALDLPPAANTRSDKILRIAAGQSVYFFDTVANSIVYTLTLNSNAIPGATTGGVGPLLFGSGFSGIKGVLSLSVDPLNGTNDTYAEVTDGARDYIIQIRADHSVRLVRNVLLEMGIASGVAPAAFYTNEGRVTAASQQLLHRLVPVLPLTSGLATEQEFRIAP